jgi:hypothetical protein
VGGGRRRGGREGNGRLCNCANGGLFVRESKGEILDDRNKV